MRMLLGGLLALAGGTAAAWWWFGAGAEPEEATAGFTVPERRLVASTVLATGVIRLRTGAEVRVGSQLSGIVEELNVTMGTRIQAGDVIARIDSRGLESRLAQALAQVRVMEQELRRAEVELARARRLDEQKLVARSELEDRELALADARARLDKARSDAAVVETDLGYAVIRAPISGVIASVSTQEGETVAASFTTPTFVTIIEDSALELVAMVDETDIGGVVPGNPVMFTVEAWPAEEFIGQVLQVAPKGTIISGVVNYEVMVTIDNPAVGRLRPDMTANVSIRTAERESLVLPVVAVHRDGGDRYVWVERDGRLARRSVVVGSRDGAVLEIRQGLAGDERVLLGAPAAGS